MDAVPDLLDNGGTSGRVDRAARRGRGHQGFCSRQAREPGVIQGERTGLGRDASDFGRYRPGGDQQGDPQRARARPEALNRAPPAASGTKVALRPDSSITPQGLQEVLDLDRTQKMKGRFQP